MTVDEIQPMTSVGRLNVRIPVADSPI